MKKQFSLVVSELEKAERLDSYIVKKITEISRSQLKNGAKSIVLNGKNAKLSSKVKNGDEIEISWEDVSSEEIAELSLKAENIPLNILYEDENVCVINKKQGMVVHPACGNWSGTLVNALLYHFADGAGYRGGAGHSSGTKSDDTKNCDTKPTLRPGIVHRLDKDTSGTIITAKNVQIESYLKQQFLFRRVKKEYIAICKGIPNEKSGNIKLNIVRDTRDRKKFTTTDDPTKGKFARTVYRCIASYGPYSLMKCKLKTGRTHQIRVHLKSIGCPILGDPIYGSKDSVFDTATLMLHSSVLSIRLPGDTEFSTFKSPTPVRFKKVMKVLHEKYKGTYKNWR